MNVCRTGNSITVAPGSRASFAATTPSFASQPKGLHRPQKPPVPTMTVVGALASGNAA